MIDYNSIRDFYNEHVDCWSDDLFSKMTTSYIDKYVNNSIKNLSDSSFILNAGSGGKTYKTVAKQTHLDIAENTLHGVDNAYVGNIIDMPFNNESFDCVICVGTVINYCEADKAIIEINRVSKKNALLILEYERSGSGLLPEEIRNTDLTLFKHYYFQELHANYLYSDHYIQSLLKQNGYEIVNSRRFNATIPWMERFASESFAHKMTIFESLFQRIPFINKYSHNAIMVCQKTQN